MWEPRGLPLREIRASRLVHARSRFSPLKGGHLFCTMGVRPTRCEEFESSGDPEKHLCELLELTKEGAARGKVVAVGECGLDYDCLQFCSADVQRRYFERQFEIAEVTKLPLFLHMRATTPDFLDIVGGNQHSKK